MGENRKSCGNRRAESGDKLVVQTGIGPAWSGAAHCVAGATC
jgi:hypothetical protein